MKQWLPKIEQMFKDYPHSSEVQWRYNSIRYLLKTKYDFEKGLDKNKTIAMLKDSVTIDRALRKATEGMEKELKDKLSEEYIEENIHG